MKTVKDMSIITGISVRTLHYYDEIGLLSPALLGENGYRFYDDDSLVRLQEILLFRELEFPLKTIKEIMDSPSYDRNQALSDQIKWLELKKVHLEKVISQAKAMQGGLDMTDFTAYNQTELEAFQKEAKERWGETSGYREFESKYSASHFSKVQEDMGNIMAVFGKWKDLDVSDEKVQRQVKVLQDYITRNCYTCTDEILAGLGQLYVADERFTSYIDSVGGNGTAHFINEAIKVACNIKAD
ncbi:MerR family transcriptional regulator [Streptococcus ictaluri]|uniref:TipAS antibiotic-recognition domain protein n=1 Tax=Streptococcus ictaluri 707-05 TaxID=764299 RepID=G5K1A6_9STRE|nr:MerR family transcriptional regulator [Streptococcus ictaluri]EHI69942.1 TipAS antibiotic-recognition domain protein [Streptococcus ictaluri 707-05]